MEEVKSTGGICLVCPMLNCAEFPLYYPLFQSFRPFRL
jgi:hypothetical protein